MKYNDINNSASNKSKHGIPIPNAIPKARPRWSPFEEAGVGVTVTFTGVGVCVGVCVGAEVGVGTGVGAEVGVGTGVGVGGTKPQKILFPVKVELTSVVGDETLTPLNVL